MENDMTANVAVSIVTRKRLVFYFNIYLFD
jgi:hypothetical protein